MTRMTGGRGVVECLKAHGVNTVFGIISTHTMHIYDALYDQQDSIRFISGRHEHALGFMADGYSRATGRPGVFFTSGGPGAADSMGSMGEAYHASSRVLQVTANAELGLINSRKGAIHEPKDQLGMFRSVTGWNTLIDDLETLPDRFMEAFRRFKDGRPRPVELEIPTDLFGHQADLEILPPQEVSPLQPNQSHVEQAAQALLSAQRPVIYCGSGVISANATVELRRLAETLGAPVLTGTTGKGAFPEDHPLSLGVGEGGGARGRNPMLDFLLASDLVLLIGSTMPYYRTLARGVKLPENVVQIDIDPDEIGKNYPVNLGLVGDAKVALQQILSLVEGRSANRAKGYSLETSRMKEEGLQDLAHQFPNELKTLEAIRDVLPRETIIATDATVPAYVSSRCLPIYEPRTFMGPNSWEGLGFGFPAGLGAKVGRPDRPVVVFTGDGGFQYNIQELGTAVQYGINPVVIVFNDGAFGVLKREQQNSFNGRFIGTALKNPNFVKLAEAYDIPATRVHTRQELTPALEDALQSDTIHLLVVEMPQGFANFS